MVETLSEAKQALAAAIADLKDKQIKDSLLAAIAQARQEIVAQLLPLLDRAQGQMSKEDLLAALAQIEITVPEIKLPDITVTMPEILPTKAPQVTVNVPTKALTNEMRAIKKAVSEQKPIDIPMGKVYTRKDPMPVIMTDLKGDPWSPLFGGGTKGERKKGLHLDEYDYVSLVSTDNREVYTFRKGGSAGSPVAGVTIVYVDSTRSTISTVTKT